MFRHGTVRRRFLHTPSSCRVGCSVCLGSLVSGRGHPTGRRAVIGASAALLTAGTFLVSPPDREGTQWREQAVVLAAELSRLEPTDGTPAGALSYELELLGYWPVPQLPANLQEPPPDDGGGQYGDEDDGGDTGGAEADAEETPNEDATDQGDDDTSSGHLDDADTGSDERTSEDSADPEEPGAEEPGAGADESAEPGDPTGRDQFRGDVGAPEWEDTAQELADLLAELGDGDEAAQELAAALAAAGFDPTTGTRDAAGSGGGGSGDGESGAGGSGAGGSGGAGEILWDADVETGDLSQFEGGGDPQQVGAPEPEIVDGRDGNHAVSFTIPGGGERNEVLPDATFSDGDEYWFGFSTLLEDGFPVDAAWQVITQWKNDGTGSPPLSLNVENGEYLLHGGFSVGKEWTESIGPATAGEWVDWVIYVEFAGGAGRVDVWQNGEQAVDGLVPEGGTLYPGKDSYLKIGYYRDTGIGEDGTVVFDNWKMGTSYDAVAPGGQQVGGSSPSSDSTSPDGSSTEETRPAVRLPDRGSGTEEVGTESDGTGSDGTGSDGAESDGAEQAARPRSSVPFTTGR